MSRLSEAVNSAREGGQRGSVSPSGNHRSGSRIKWEFSAAAITVPAEQAKHRNLRLIGALARKFAQESMRYNHGISWPGSPPNSHTGLLRDSIFYRLSDDSVIVGPAEFSTRGGYSVPEVLEFGGSVTRLIWSYRRRKRVAILERIHQHFRARPYMGPALERATGPFKDLWKNCI